MHDFCTIHSQVLYFTRTDCTDNLRLKKRTQAVVVVVVLTNGGRGCRRLESTELPALAQPQVSTATQARLPMPHHYTAVEIIVPLQARTLSFVQANAYDNSYRKRAAFLITFFIFLPIPLAHTMSFNTINMSGTTIRRRKKKSLVLSC